MWQYWRERLFVAKRWSQQPEEPPDMRGSRGYAMSHRFAVPYRGFPKYGRAVGSVVSMRPPAQNFIDQVEHLLHFCRDISARILPFYID